jgi:hypothetical protein
MLFEHRWRPPDTRPGSSGRSRTAGWYCMRAVPSYALPKLALTYSPDGSPPCRNTVLSNGLSQRHGIDALAVPKRPQARTVARWAWGFLRDRYQ